MIRRSADYTQHKRRFRILGIFALGAGVLACAPQKSAERPTSPSGNSDKPSQKQKSKYVQAQIALNQGKYQRGGRLLEEAFVLESKGDNNNAGAGLLLGQFYLLVGRYEEVDALKVKQNSKGLVLAGAEALRHRGRLDEAKADLQKSRTGELHSSEDFLVELIYGEILLEKGNKQEAREVLIALLAKANQGDLLELAPRQRGKAWAIVGRAAHLLRSPEDANEAFNEAEQIVKADLDLLLWRTELFVEKFDLPHAHEVLSEANEQSPHHPDVLLANARFKLVQALSFEEAENIAHRVLAINPRHTEAFCILAGIELRDLNLKASQKWIDRGLQENPRHLKLLSLRAATQFLAEDPLGFEETVTQVHELSPGYTEIFRIVGEYAEWEHRYPDIERLMRRAVRMDREDGRSRAMLGLTLVRSASDAAGIVELGRSFELDPYNLRVLNTLDLYEKIIPRDYEEIEEGPFRFRFPKEESKLLARYVPPLMMKAHGEMSARYSFTPQAPIGIEIYASREQFAVRTGGLPRTAIQGVCFGRKLATISPIGSPGNLGMTLWHELGHVFHIGLSKNRVPRWLTEGLAEWETATRKVGWSRELDLNLFRAKREERLPQLGSMSQAFTRARRQEDVATAYYASQQIVDWIIDSRGKIAAVSLLRELGNKRLPVDVVPEVLGASFDALDMEFRDWLGGRLGRFDQQFVSREERRTVDALRLELKDVPKDRKKRLSLGFALLSAGKAEDAERQFLDLVKERPLQAPTAEGATLLREVDNNQISLHATFALARIALSREEKTRARDLIQGALASGHDGFELRMVLARTLLAIGDGKAASAQLSRATQLDPHATEAWSLLASLRHKEGDASGELQAVRKWAEFDEHEPVVHRRLIEMLLEEELFEEAARAAEMAIWVDLAGVDTHRLAALAFSHAGQSRRAKFEWESALLCPATREQKEQLQNSWIEDLKRQGKVSEIIEVRTQIMKML